MILYFLDDLYKRNTFDSLQQINDTKKKQVCHGQLRQILFEEF